MMFWHIALGVLGLAFAAWVLSGVAPMFAFFSCFTRKDE